ncbi:hypothetical protein [Sphingobacterium sp. UDSM-2020]|uniref:hypothetical protein n=1 Tax=Sphingobacterium sp. UDSM-2020 TaxID=2795738 RepID=UPI001936E920|nr:hypothetical protein [Sphingobacterium sp. UDSM-2020]QQD13405.1 hypothetical protein JAZ75_22905 [Sphingobacterium sp. UDSM-2020]
MKYIFLNILILLTILGCSRNDLQLKDESNLSDIELLKADFQSDSTAFSKSANRPKLNYRQSLQRVLYWEYATKKGKSTYIPIQQYLPKGSITTSGQNFLPHRAWLVIERDSIAKSNNYKILTLISDKSVVNYTNFEGISLLEDYFTGTRIDAIKYGVDENPISQEKRAKLYALGGWGSVCSPEPNSSMRCGPNLSCEYIKIATVCPGMTDTYCAPRYEWNCVRRLGPIDPDNPDPTGPPDPGTWPNLPGNGSGNSPISPSDKEIIDALDGYPCAQAVLAKIPNLENKISLWLNKMFKNNVDYNIIFRVSTALDNNVDAVWNNNNAVGTTQTISLNSKMLNTASQEYIAATMFHEVLHSFLFNEENRLKQEGKLSQFGILYPGWSSTDIGMQNKYVNEHSTIATTLQDLANAIKSFNPSMSSSHALTLAKGGIVSNMIQLEQDINQNYRHGGLGTKCN